MSESYNQALHNIMVRDLPGMAANMCRYMREFPVNCASRSGSAGLAFDSHWNEVVGVHLLPSGGVTMKQMLATLKSVVAVASFIIINKHLWKPINNFIDMLVVNLKLAATAEYSALEAVMTAADVEPRPEGTTYIQAGYTYNQTTVNSPSRDTIDVTTATSGYDFYDVCRWLSKQDFTGAMWTILSFAEYAKGTSNYNPAQSTVVGEIISLMEAVNDRVFPVFLDINHRIRDLAKISQSDDDSPEFLEEAPWGIDVTKSGWTEIPVPSSCFSFKLPEAARYQLLIKLPEAKDFKSASGTAVRRNVVLEYLGLGSEDTGVFRGGQLSTSEARNNDSATEINLLSDYFATSGTFDMLTVKFSDTGSKENLYGAVCDATGKYANSNLTGSYVFRPAWVKLYVRKVGKSVDKTVVIEDKTIEEPNDIKFTGASQYPISSPDQSGPKITPLTSLTYVGFRNTEVTLSGPQAIWGTQDTGTELEPLVFNYDKLHLQTMVFDVSYPTVGYTGRLKLRTKYPFVVMGVLVPKVNRTKSMTNNASEYTTEQDVVTGMKFVTPLVDTGNRPFADLVPTPKGRAIITNELHCFNAAWPVRILVAHLDDAFSVTKQKLVEHEGEMHAPQTASDAIDAYSETSQMDLRSIVDLYSTPVTFQVRLNDSEYLTVEGRHLPFIYNSVNSDASLEAISKYALADIPGAVFSELVWIDS